MLRPHSLLVDIALKTNQRAAVINKVLQYGRGMNVKVGMPQITMMRTAISDLMLEKGIAREAGAIAGLSHIEALVVAAENRKFISLRGEKTHIP